MNEVEFRSIRGWPNYFAGSDGNIYSTKVSMALRLLKPSTDSHGYFYVKLYRGEEKKKFSVHKLIAEAFLGPCPEGMEVLHGLGGKKDNSPRNLSYGTHSANMQDCLRDGTGCRGKDHEWSLLKEEDVLHIRSLYAQGKTVAELSRMYNRSDSCIDAVVKRRSWKHV